MLLRVDLGEWEGAVAEVEMGRDDTAVILKRSV
jgi:hypothetical protein